MRFTNTFSPYRMGQVDVKNRLIMPAMDSGVFDQNGMVRQATLDYYGARAAAIQKQMQLERKFQQMAVFR